MLNCYELSIDISYIDWTVPQGIRELVQNAIDGSVKGHPMDIDYNESQERLIISNKGITIPKGSLLLGYTTKRGDIDTIGEYGEGYKLGCLALVRAGLDVSIFNGPEEWKPVRKKSEAFDRDVLAFEIYENPDELNKDLTIMVNGLSNEVWQECRKMFLQFAAKGKEYETPFGYILDDPKMGGQVYVNGILVEKISDEQFHFGYNLKPGQITVDRDRKMANRHELKTVTGKALVYFANQSDDQFSMFENLMKKNSPDIQNLAWSWALDSNLKNKLYESFLKDFGEKAVPVLSDEDVARANYIGKYAYKYGEAYVRVIQERTGNLDELSSRFAQEVNKEFETLDLNEVETANFYNAWKVLTSVVSTSMPEIRVAEFSDEGTLGLFYRKDGKATVFISRKVLIDFGQTLRTMIHEFSHTVGTDGSQEHQHLVEETWRDVYVSLHSKLIKREQL